MLIKAEARVDRVGIAELAPVEGASGTFFQGGMVAVAVGQWDEHGGSSMPFGWAGDAAWCATLSTTRRASTYTGSAAAGGRKGVREKSVPAFDGRYPGMPCAVWDTRIAPVRSIHAIVTTGAAGVLLNVTPRYSLFHRWPEEPPGSGFCDAYLGAGMETSPYLVA